MTEIESRDFTCIQSSKLLKTKGKNIWTILKFECMSNHVTLSLSQQFWAVLGHYISYVCIPAFFHAIKLRSKITKKFKFFQENKVHIWKIFLLFFQHKITTFHVRINDWMIWHEFHSRITKCTDYQDCRRSVIRLKYRRYLLDCTRILGNYVDNSFYGICHYES